MGTPDFAVPTLTTLLNSADHQVKAVFTATPKPKGRGLEESLSPVHKLALEHNVPIYTPVTLKSPEIIGIINSIEADIIIVVAYGFIIPKNILYAKKYGSLNLHPSDLPKYRGAAPMQRTIIDGETESAVCIMQMDEGLDTGDIILKERFSLSPRITLPILHDQCASIGAQLFIKVLNNISSLPRIKQATEGASYAHKLSKEEGKIKWHEAASKIDCKIRGMSPWPGAYFEYQGKTIKILEADYSQQEHNFAPGTVISDKFEIACGAGTLTIKSLQQAGKTRLSVEEFLRGNPVAIGTNLCSKD